MSLKPLILIFQEVAQPTTVAVTPDLNSVIVGPAYDVLDYPDDGDALLLPGAYGSLETAAYTPPATGSDAVTVLDGGYPSQSPGSRVDHASVRVTLRMPRIILGSTYLDVGIAPVLGTSITTSASDRTLITLNSPTTDFVAAGVQPGDRMIMTSSGGQTVTRVVASIGEANAQGLVPGGNEIYLRLTSQLPASGSGADQWVYSGTGECRVERTLQTQDLVDSGHTLLIFPEPGSDKLTLRGGVTVTTSITPRPTVTVPSPTASTVTRSLSYAQIYLSYRALRQDLQGLRSALQSAEQTINGVPTIVGIGKIDARNPLAVGVKLALNNAGAVPIYYYGISADDSTGYANARARLATNNALYCFVALTQDLNIHAAFKTAFDQSASPVYARDHGVNQRFRMHLGSIPLPRAETVYQGSISGVSNAVGTMTSGNYRTVSFASTSTGSLGVRAVLPGDSITIGLSRTGAAAWQNRRGTHRVGHVNSSVDYPNPGDPSELEVIPSSSRWDDTSGASAADVEVLVRAPDGTVKVSVLAEVDISTGSGGTLGTINFAMLAPTVTGGPYTIVYATGSALAISVVGFAITITLNAGVTTHAQVAAAVNTHPFLSLIMLATVSAGGSHVVDYHTQTPRTAVTGQTGAAASMVAVDPTHNQVNGLTGMVAASAGRYLTITGAMDPANNGTFLITSVIDATSVVIYNATPGTLPDAGALTWTEYHAYSAILPVSGSATATVVINDALFNELEDDSAGFMTAGILPGDLLEIPLDPNNYGPAAFEGRLLTYRVGALLNENKFRIANGFDDDASTARELPHYFARDLQDRYIDDALPNAISYRVRRTLTTDEQVLALISISQSVKSKRLTLMWPDIVGVSGLCDGSLPRSLPSVRALAGTQPSYYLACAVAGVIAGTPAQMGLTNGSFIGIDRLVNSTDLFDEEQLSVISDGGYFVCTQATEGALPVCEHQLTTDPTTLETGELSVVKNVDFLSIFFRDLLRSFLGQYNNIPEALNEIFRSVSDNTELLKGRTLAKIGPPLLSGSITSLAPSAVAADTVEMFYSASVPRPLNNIGFHLVVTR